MSGKPSYSLSFPRYHAVLPRILNAIPPSQSTSLIWILSGVALTSCGGGGGGGGGGGPVVSGPKTSEGATYSFTAKDFGFDNASDAVPITILSAPNPEHGRLELNGDRVSEGRTIPVASIENLEFRPAQAALTYHAEFSYRVSGDSESRTFGIEVTATDDHATALTLGSQSLSSFNENTEVSRGRKVATITVADPDGAAHGLVVTGEHAHFFDIQDENPVDGKVELWLRPHAGFDREDLRLGLVNNNLVVRIQIPEADIDVSSESLDITVSVGNVNDNPAVITVEDNTQEVLNEGTIPSGTMTGYRFSATDADGGEPRWVVHSTSGQIDNRFRIDSNGNLVFARNVTIDYENRAEREIVLDVVALNTSEGIAPDTPLANSGQDSERVTITFTVNNIDEMPVFVTLPSGYSFRDDIDATLPAIYRNYTPITLGKVEAIDPDGTTITYSIGSILAQDSTGNAVTLVEGVNLEQYLEIDDTGLITFEGPPIYDISTSSFSQVVLTVTATDETGMEATSGEITIGLVNIDNGDAEFTISTSGSMELPRIGDVLSAGLDANAYNGGKDPDGSTESSFDPKYQWYHVGSTIMQNTDILGASSATYTVKITDAGKRIGVRVSYAERSLESDATTPRGTEVVLTALEIAVAQDIQSDIDSGNGNATAMESYGRYIIDRLVGFTVLKRFPSDADKNDGTLVTISGDDRSLFEFIQDGDDVLLVSKIGFDYENPDDQDKSNSYAFNVTSLNSIGHPTGVKNYSLTITDNPHDNPQEVMFGPGNTGGIVSARITETDNILMFTSLKDAVESHAEIKSKLDEMSANFIESVVDSDDPRRATVKYMAGLNEIVFTYVVIGQDVNDVILVQNRNDVSLVTTHRLDFDNPTDSFPQDPPIPPDHVYSVMEKITTSASDYPSEVSKTYNLTVTDDSSETSIQLYESHPLHKSIDTPFGDLSGYHLTDGYGDNAFFRIENGKLWWVAVPDFETPRDRDGDSKYEIKLTPTAAQGQTHEGIIVVNDLGMKIDPTTRYVPSISIRPIDFTSENLPTDPFIHHLFLGGAWKMPETGPLLITYSISKEDRDELANEVFPNNNAKLENFYDTLSSMLMAFEKVANIKFIEIEYGEEEFYTYEFDNKNYLTIPHFYLSFQDTTGSAAAPGENSVFIQLGHQRIISIPEWVILHEFAHGLRLHHPFEDSSFGKGRDFDMDRDWPGNEIYENSQLSILSYDLTLTTLKQADIDALQFLYGAPGTNYEGVESRIIYNTNRPVITQIDTTQNVLTEGLIPQGTDTGYVFSVFDEDGGTPILEVNDQRFEIDMNGRLLFAKDVNIDFDALTNGQIRLEILADDPRVGLGFTDDARPVRISLTFTEIESSLEPASGLTASDTAQFQKNAEYSVGHDGSSASGLVIPADSNKYDACEDSMLCELASILVTDTVPYISDL